MAVDFGADGTLYGARDALYTIDTATGIANLVGSGGYSDLRGIAVIDGTSVRVLNIDGLIKTKTDYREKDLLDKRVLERIRDGLKNGISGTAPARNV